MSRKTPPYRYALVLEVRTPDGLCMGKSVRERQWHGGAGGCWWNFPFAENKPFLRETGEAAVVQLPHGKCLFATMMSRVPMKEPALVTLTSEELARLPYGARQLYPRPRFVRDEMPAGLPTIVTFDTLADPKTIRTVDPERLEDTFGSGYSLERAYVVPTKEPITSGILDLLPWLPQYWGRFLGDFKTLSIKNPGDPALGMAANAFISAQPSTKPNLLSTKFRSRWRRIFAAR